jgi:cbb3-type cytochrome oxidase subunit 3
MMMARDMSWSGFFKRQVKYTLGTLALFLFFWNGVVIWEWLYALFGGELRGYGPGEQRWHRVWAMGFLGMYLVGSLMDFIAVWYWQKYPEKRRYPKEEG